MTIPSTSEQIGKGRTGPWLAWLVFVASVVSIPVSYAIGAARSGENHFGQGLEGSNFWTIFAIVHLLAFAGLLAAPCLTSQSNERKGCLMFLGIAAFLVDEFLSFAFIAFGMFPD